MFSSMIRPRLTTVPVFTSATARAAYEEFVADVLAAVEEKSAAFAALDDDLSTLSADQVHAELTFLDSLTLVRTRISQGRRALLGCTQLTRQESELLLGELSSAMARWDRLLASEVPARKAALNRQLEIAAVAVLAGPATPPPSARTPVEILTAASQRLRPMGIARIGEEYHLLLHGQRMRAGQTFTVQLDREYTVTLSVVSRTSYTLAFEGETLVVPME